LELVCGKLAVDDQSWFPGIWREVSVKGCLGEYLLPERFSAHARQAKILPSNIRAAVIGHRRTVPQPGLVDLKRARVSVKQRLNCPFCHIQEPDTGGPSVTTAPIARWQIEIKVEQIAICRAKGAVSRLRWHMLIQGLKVLRTIEGNSNEAEFMVEEFSIRLCYGFATQYLRMGRAESDRYVFLVWGYARRAENPLLATVFEQHPTDACLYVHSKELAFTAKNGHP
jgi:hypothetical protein